ncbi:ATP synthase F1 subunit epsilon [Acidocella sp.]|uniref:ATP synthase F1 subunit epsilon n=1 Tax=Acidocella sp. TaxID=50710 RepID=UPI00261B3646|nr:ATP synthase F1 subunit epsilon [Acidocella sp.]
MSLALEIISPERLLLARDVDMVVIPGTEGDLGILPGHAKLVTSLRGGLVDLYEAGAVTDRFFVTGGFAEVTESRCSVLADTIIRQAEIDKAKAEAELSAAQAAYAAVDLTDADAYREASDRLIAAQAMVDSALPSPSPAKP